MPGTVLSPLTNAIFTRNCYFILQMGKLRHREVKDAAKATQPVIGRVRAERRPPGSEPPPLCGMGPLGEKDGLAFPLSPFWGILGAFRGEAVCVGSSALVGRGRTHCTSWGLPDSSALPSLPWASLLLCGCHLHPALPSPTPRSIHTFSSCKHLDPPAAAAGLCLPQAAWLRAQSQGLVRSYLPRSTQPGPTAQDQWPRSTASSVLGGGGLERAGPPGAAVYDPVNHSLSPPLALMRARAC